MNFAVRKNIFEDEISKIFLSFLVLDFNRPEESLKCLSSIRNHVKFPHNIIFYSNGGNQDYVWDLYKKGLIDILILSKKNEGSGIGTIRLTEICPSGFFINLQCDNFLIRDFAVEEFIEMARKTTPESPIIDLALVGKDVFSERAFFSHLAYYSRNPYQEGGGTGPTQVLNLINSEQATTKFLKEENKQIYHWPHRLIADNGKYAIIETPCGGILKRRCDTQELKIEKIPKQKMPAFNLSDDEWNEILAGKWQDWRIPKQSREWVFHFYSNDFEDPANELYRRK